MCTVHQLQGDSLTEGQGISYFIPETGHSPFFPLMRVYIISTVALHFQVSKLVVSDSKKLTIVLLPPPDGPTCIEEPIQAF